ncbi:MAG: hypothetical protein FWD25_05850 [Clostridia bacterium]|nr:hypothetical protein [Clostridia bacterium]
MDGLIVVAIIWFVFRMIAANAKKHAEVRKKAEREETVYGYRPKPEEETPRRGWSEWADMLGKVLNEEKEVAPKGWTVSSHPAFPTEPQQSEPTPKKIVQSAKPTPAFVQEREKLTPIQPTREAPVMNAQDFLPERWDASALVRGVIFSEILTRPAQRRRPGMPRMR